MKEHSDNPGQFPVIILAAGLSGRMGFPKPFLKWDAKRTFLEKIIAEYISVRSREIIVVMNNEGYCKVKNEMPQIESRMLGTKIVVNTEPEKGRFRSVKLGLAAIAEIQSCFIQNIDNPFVNFSLLAGLNTQAESHSYVVPVYEGRGGHPILLGTEIIKYILSLNEADLDLRELLNKFKRTEVETNNKNILININSMEEYRKYF
jgi:molybdenum cofactor cytidylyltransferase